MTHGFPTPAHRRAADAIIAFFAGVPGVDAVLLVNSLARGVGTPVSDIDIAVLIDPAMPAGAQAELDARWRGRYLAGEVFEQLRRAGPFSGVHLDLFDGRLTPQVWDDAGGPDGFELEVGNRLAYGVALWDRGPALAGLRAAWLPYYGDELRAARLAMARAACAHDLAYVPFYVGRGLYFQAFDRLYKAFQEFLQALFIARRAYPLAYNKWIREQVAEHLGLPELYAQLPHILEIPRLESVDSADRAALLGELLERWAPAER